MNIKSVPIGEMLFACSLIHSGRHGPPARAMRVTLTQEEKQHCTKHAIIQSGLFDPTEENYWLFITVEHSGVCAPEDIDRLFQKYMPFFKATEIHKSKNFTNANYFEGNYLQFHVYKVEEA